MPCLRWRWWWLLTTAINRNCAQISINFPWNVSFMQARQNAGKPLQYYRHELLSQVLYQVESTSVHCNTLHFALWPPGLTDFIWEYDQSLHLLPYMRCNFSSMSSLKWWFNCMMPHSSGINVWADNNKSVFISLTVFLTRPVTCSFPIFLPRMYLEGAEGYDLIWLGWNW